MPQHAGCLWQLPSGMSHTVAVSQDEPLLLAQTQPQGDSLLWHSHDRHNPCLPVTDITSDSLLCEEGYCSCDMHQSVNAQCIFLYECVLMCHAVYMCVQISGKMWCHLLQTTHLFAQCCKMKNIHKQLIFVIFASPVKIIILIWRTSSI